MQYLKIIFNFFLSGISFFCPNSSHYAIVGGWYGKRYADNSKAIFQYLNDNKERLGLRRIFWYTNNKNIADSLKAEGKDVLYGVNSRSVYWHLRSKVHFIDQNPHDILGFLSVRSIRINLWHGIPLKSIGHSKLNSIPAHKKWMEKWASGGFWVDQISVAPSKKGAELLSDGLGIPTDKFLILSYPRTIPLYVKKEPCCEQEFKVFYLPTFRDSGQRCPLLDLDLEEINKRFVEGNIQFFVKPHFASKADWNVAGTYSNIHVLGAEEDVYGYLGDMDLLITDYSSVYFDFLLTNRPILFFCYDLDYYQNSDRGFLLPYEEYTPGDKIYRPDDLIEKIIWVKNNFREYMSIYSADYKKVNDEMNLFQDKPNLDMLDEIFIKNND